MPNVYPTVLYKENYFENESQKRRYETTHQKLSDLRYLIDKNKGENEYEMIRDFLEINKINDNTLFSVDNFFKISQFLRSEFVVNPKFSLIEILQKVVKNEIKIESLKKKVVSKSVKENIENTGKSIDSFNMKDYYFKLENLFNKRFIPFKPSQIDTINRLEIELEEATEKVINKKIARLKSKKLKIVESKDVDSMFEYDDLDDIKKKRKLLELIVVIENV